MVDFLKRLTKNIPTFITAFVLAIAVWILAVNSTDPVEKRNYPRGIPIEIIGLAPNLVITNGIPEQVTVVLSAPSSLWEFLINDQSAIRVILDLNGLDAGRHDVEPIVQVNTQPSKVENVLPRIINVTLEQLYSESFAIQLEQPSKPAVGYDAGPAELSHTRAMVSGPASYMQNVKEVQAILDISQASEDIDIELPLQAYDQNGLVVEGVSISPTSVNVKMKITQRGGYRNVTVKVVTSGQIARGYRLTNISVNPLAVTVYSTDTELINALPGFVETQTINLNGADEGFKTSIPLVLPAGITVVGESTVEVTVTISPIQGSQTLSNKTIEIVGLSPEYKVTLSPALVDVILSGPLPILDTLRANDVRIILDLTNFEPGVYQVVPIWELDIDDLLVESILPATIEVIISIPTTPTP